MTSRSHQIRILQYDCKCGKAFSGEPKRINLLLKMHYKICKYPPPENLSNNPNPVVIHMSDNGSKNNKITEGHNQLNSEGQIALKSFMGSL